MKYERYAIYWAPPRGSPLACFGQAWLGADAETGAFASAREHFGLPHELAERAVASPRRYCLHVTMKAPFRLAPDRSEAGLCAAIAAFCARRRKFAAGPLKLETYERYLALIPSSPLAELDWLAMECVTHFDRFRAPLGDVDRGRRTILDARQSARLEEFGYHLIFGDFRSHITLAGPLAQLELGQVSDALASGCSAFTANPLIIEELCLFGDPGGEGPFQIVQRFPLMR